MIRAFDTAVAEARKSPMRHKIGAAITDHKYRVLASGHNRAKTHPMQRKYAVQEGLSAKCYLHAEMDALVKLFRKRESAPCVIVVRLSRGRLRMARPCPICYAALTEAGVREITYSTNNEVLETEVIT